MARPSFIYAALSLARVRSDATANNRDQACNQVGDLSLVYPLARGTGPLVVVLGALVFLGERPTAAIVIGTCLISAGIVTLVRVGRLTLDLFSTRRDGARRRRAYRLLHPVG